MVGIGAVAIAAFLLRRAGGADAHGAGAPGQARRRGGRCWTCTARPTPEHGGGRRAAARMARPPRRGRQRRARGRLRDRAAHPAADDAVRILAADREVNAISLDEDDIVLTESDTSLHREGLGDLIRQVAPRRLRSADRRSSARRADRGDPDAFAVARYAITAAPSTRSPSVAVLIPAGGAVRPGGWVSASGRFVENRTPRPRPVACSADRRDRGAGDPYVFCWRGRRARRVRRDARERDAGGFARGIGSPWPCSRCSPPRSRRSARSPRPAERRRDRSTARRAGPGGASCSRCRSRRDRRGDGRGDPGAGPGRRGRLGRHRPLQDARRDRVPVRLEAQGVATGPSAPSKTQFTTDRASSRSCAATTATIVRSSTVGAETAELVREPPSGTSRPQATPSPTAQRTDGEGSIVRIAAVSRRSTPSARANTIGTARHERGPRRMDHQPRGRRERGTSALLVVLDLAGESRIGRDHRARRRALAAVDWAWVPGTTSLVVQDQDGFTWLASARRRPRAARLTGDAARLRARHRSGRRGRLDVRAGRADRRGRTSRANPRRCPRRRRVDVPLRPNAGALDHRLVVVATRTARRRSTDPGHRLDDPRPVRLPNGQYVNRDDRLHGRRPDPPDDGAHRRAHRGTSARCRAAPDWCD